MFVTKYLPKTTIQWIFALLAFAGFILSFYGVWTFFYTPPRPKGVIIIPPLPEPICLRPPPAFKNAETYTIYETIEKRKPVSRPPQKLFMAQAQGKPAPTPQPSPPSPQTPSKPTAAPSKLSPSRLLPKPGPSAKTTKPGDPIEKLLMKNP